MDFNKDMDIPRYGLNFDDIRDIQYGQMNSVLAIYCMECGMRRDAWDLHVFILQTI